MAPQGRLKSPPSPYLVTWQGLLSVLGQLFSFSGSTSNWHPTPVWFYYHFIRSFMYLKNRVIRKQHSDKRRSQPLGVLLKSTIWLFNAQQTANRPVPKLRDLIVRKWGWFRKKPLVHTWFEKPRAARTKENGSKRGQFFERLGTIRWPHAVTQTTVINFNKIVWFYWKIQRCNKSLGWRRENCHKWWPTFYLVNFYKGNKNKS